MIFQGAHNRALILDELERNSLLRDWQLIDGVFPDIDYGAKEIENLSARRAVMDNSRFTSSTIRNGSIEQCSLQNVSFSETQLINCIMISSQLRSLILDNCSLTGGSLRGCAAPRLSINRARLQGLSIIEPEISHAKIAGLSVFNCNLNADHPSGLTGIRNSSIANSLFINCRIKGNFFAFSRLENSLFLDCRFIEADWTLTEREGGSFINCQNGPSESQIYNDHPHGQWSQWERNIAV